jgi:hypothetical protein
LLVQVGQTRASCLASVHSGILDRAGAQRRANETSFWN